MIHWHASLPSTMTAAAELAANGCEDLTVVAAEEQTAGQGRLGRTWHSERGAGLYASVVLRISEPLPVVTLALGIAVQGALRAIAGLEPDLRWPNDVMLRDRKVCGILTQFASGAVIAGIGVNLNQSSFPPELAKIATSLKIETGREFSPKLVLDALLPPIRTATQMPAAEIRSRFTRSSSWATGKHVFIEEMNLHGITGGLDAAGFLLVRDSCGKVHTIVAGGVRAARA